MFGLALVIELSQATGREGDAVEKLRIAEPGSAIWAGEVAVAISELLKSSGTIDDAVEHLRQVRRSPGITGPIAGRLARQTGTLLEKKGRFTEALAEFEDAARLAEGDTDVSRALALQSLAIGYLTAGRLDDAAGTADRAIAAAEAAHSDLALLSALVTRGDICLASGQDRLAIRHFHAALLAQARTGLRNEEILLLNNIAQSYGRLGQIELVVMYQMWALDSSMELRDLPNKALALSSLAGWMDPAEGRAIYTEAFQIYPSSVTCTDRRWFCSEWRAAASGWPRTRTSGTCSRTRRTSWRWRESVRRRWTICNSSARCTPSQPGWRPSRAMRSGRGLTSSDGGPPLNHCGI